MEYAFLNNYLSVNTINNIEVFTNFINSNSKIKKIDIVFNQYLCEKSIDLYYGIKQLRLNFRVTIQRLFCVETSKNSMMVAEDPDWTNFTIYADENQQEAIQELILVGFYSYMSLRQTLLMHASAVNWNGQGLVFTAPSGTGKTTQAELWARYKGAKILNGDKVFLKQEEDAIHAWGSPWKGSSPYALNESAPLKAIIVLRQAKENSIRRLSTLEAMELFVPHVFFPKWDEKCEQAVLDFLDVVMSQTPIYLLCCRPDEEAVELTEGTIFGGNPGETDGESNEK